jgi:hypothetical protein
VINNLVAPPAVQILLKVRFAEVPITPRFLSGAADLNPQDLSSDGDWLARASPTAWSGSCCRIRTRTSEDTNASITKGVLKKPSRI